MDHYNDLIWSVTGILSSDIIYGDNRRRVCFGSSEGSYIEQEFNHVVSRISAQAKKGGDVQQAGFSLGSLGDYKLVAGLDEKVIDAAKRAVDLLSA
jgi:predicted Zn-dependent protease